MVNHLSEDRPSPPGGGGEKQYTFADVLHAIGPAKNEQSGAWSGSRLWEDTKCVPLRYKDLEGRDGIEGVYEDSLILPVVISAIQNGTLVDFQRVLEKEGKLMKGMLLPFRERSLLRRGGGDSPSVLEQMREGLRDAQKARRGTPVRDGHNKLKPILEGKMLVARNTTERPILAWASWWRSQLSNQEERKSAADAYTNQVRTLLKGLNLDQGLKVEIDQLACRVLLFDTLNANVKAPGAASALFPRLPFSRWLDQGYDRILTYRHKILQVVNVKGRAGVDVPQGNNDTSRQFFEQRGFRDLGTLLADSYAIRQTEEGKSVRILSTQGYMIADLTQARALSNLKDADAKDRFGAL